MSHKIQLLSHSVDTVNFLIGTKRYTYPNLDGIIVKHIVALADRAPGKALAVAKRYVKNDSQRND